MQTREQRYASKVFTQVEAFQKERFEKNPAAHNDPALDPEIRKYGSMAHKLPVLIRMAGLAQALAFLQTRNEDVLKKRLYADLIDVVKEIAQGDLTLTKVIASDISLNEYMRLTQESLHALLWFKRYAQSVLKVEDASGVEDT